ncbi:MAG: serine/threonine protein kinase [Gemmataceae bacterium]|nr:serine/threonine protein kinase [Gemmataceae bacterium]
MKFTHASGQRPLDGFTIKRGIGKGGFGEVYFALSDGGKEVALKLLKGDAQAELRGVAQCLNLKHPNLVWLYDRRTDAAGNHWVVMEYVAGEPLNVPLGRHPTGLPRETARDWFLGLCRAVCYLHGAGIVHRDLKPANVFLENGTVKVGDYGLSKAMGGASSAQTQSVGTVHYMAPEIGSGKYTKQVDVYAAGVMLYEMVTGKLPFDGESAGEILMKHLTAAPALEQAPAEWRPILAKALSKSPESRYANLGDMARDVDAIGREAAPAVVAEKKAEPVPLASPPPAQTLPELASSLMLAGVFAGLGSLLYLAVRPENEAIKLAGNLFVLSLAASWAVLVPSRLWPEKEGEAWERRLALMGLGALVGLLACWMDGWLLSTNEPPEHVLSMEASYVCLYALAFALPRWWQWASKRREERFSFLPVLVAGFLGGLLLLALSGPVLAAAVLAMSAAIVQLASPWQPPAPASARRPNLRYA